MPIPTCTDLTPVSLIRYHGKCDVFHHLRISHSTLDRWIRKGDFPPPLKVGRKVVGWPPELMICIKY
ncbi:helix-turn-helix transcriptional regulator [Atlantibacter hermannii]|uniref:helix-turn-helix transcriptional regulator n=1 Tax=Atlantibacter hermannii TaxID=565 RepID=UPI003A8DDF4A